MWTFTVPSARLAEGQPASTNIDVALSHVSRRIKTAYRSLRLVCRQRPRSLLVVHALRGEVTEYMRPPLEPPTADPRIIWDIYFSSHILPVVALADEKGVLRCSRPLRSRCTEAAAQLQVSDEWAEIILGTLAALQLVRLQDGRYRNADAARSFLLPNSRSTPGSRCAVCAAQCLGTAKERDW